MRIISALLGDGLPRSQVSKDFVRAYCEQPLGAERPAKGYVCLSCRSYVTTAAHLVEHLGALLKLSHVLAERCGYCMHYHPVPELELERLRSQAQLWPISSPTDSADAGAIEPDEPTHRKSSG